MRSIDAVEVATGTLEHLRTLAKLALRHGDEAIEKLDGLSSKDPSLSDGVVGVHVHALSANTYVDDIRQILDCLLGEDESGEDES